MDIGKKIQELRKSRGLTQKQLAEKVGVSTGTIQQYELGKRKPRFDIMSGISLALDYPVEAFTNNYDITRSFGCSELFLMLENAPEEKIGEIMQTYSTQFSEFVLFLFHLGYDFTERNNEGELTTIITDFNKKKSFLVDGHFQDLLYSMTKSYIKHCILTKIEDGKEIEFIPPDE